MSKHEKQQKGTGTGRQFVLTTQTKTIERDWHWMSISAIFGFTFSNQVLTPDIYGAHWWNVTSAWTCTLSSICFLGLEGHYLDNALL